MRLPRSLFVFAMSLLTMGCSTDLYGLAVGDLSGIWIASEYEFSSAQTTVDLVQRDGASMTIAIDGSLAPPTVATTFLDGLGSSTTASGTVDVGAPTLSIGGDTFSVDRSGSRMTLINTAGMFDFGDGITSATLTIMLSRL